MSSSDSDGYRPGTTSSIRHKFNWRRRQSTGPGPGHGHWRRRWPGHGVVLPPVWMMNNRDAGGYYPATAASPYCYCISPYQYGEISTHPHHMMHEQPAATSTVSSKSNQKHTRSTSSSVSKRIQIARQHAAAVCIQHWWRRKLPAVQRRHDLIQDLCEEICQQLLEDFIRGEFLPDMFLEIFAEDSNRFAAYSEDVVICKDLADDISHAVVSDLLRLTLRDVIHEMVDLYLTQCSAERYPSLLQSIIDSIIEEQSRHVLPDLIREVVNNMVNEYLQYVEHLAYTEAIIGPVIDEITADLCQQTCVEQWASILIQDWTQDIVMDFCTDILQNAVQIANQDRIRGELNIVQDYSSIILNQSILQILLHKLATNDENATIGYQLERILDRAVLGRCLHIQYSLHDQIKQVNHNVALWSLHDTITSQISAEIVLALLQDQLQTDLDLQ